MALVYRTVKSPKVAVFTSAFTLITLQPDIVQTSPLYHPKARRKSFLLIIILQLRPSFTLSALLAKIVSTSLKTGLQHYSMIGITKNLYTGPSLKGHSKEDMPPIERTQILAACTLNACDAPCHQGHLSTEERIVWQRVILLQGDYVFLYSRTSLESLLHRQLKRSYSSNTVKHQYFTMYCC